MFGNLAALSSYASHFNPPPFQLQLSTMGIPVISPADPLSCIISTYRNRGVLLSFITGSRETPEPKLHFFFDKHLIALGICMALKILRI